MARTYLPNGCYFTELTVNPANWKSSKAPVRKPWYFTYRFYDPRKVTEYPQGRLVSVRGMNDCRTQAERMAITEKLIETELAKLQVQGYNVITGEWTPFYDLTSDIIPQTPLPQALEIAYTKLKCGKRTKEEMRGCLVHIKEAINLAKLSGMTVGSVSRKYVVRILEALAVLKGKKWSAHAHNKFRTYLQMLFKIVVKVEALEANPVTEIEKEKIVERIKDVLTDEQRKRIVAFLSTNYPSFHRYTQIFFHSGGRSSELFQVKVKDVNLETQQYKVTIRKGRRYVEVAKTIKNIALNYWKELLSDGEFIDQDDYIFSRGLRPGPVKIDPGQISRRWRVHVKNKKKLNIQVDFYRLKHLNTTEVTDQLNEEMAAKLNSHVGTGMVVKIYDTKQEKRNHQILKRVSNKL